MTYNFLLSSDGCASIWGPVVEIKTGFTYNIATIKVRHKIRRHMGKMFFSFSRGTNKNKTKQTAKY